MNFRTFLRDNSDGNMAYLDKRGHKIAKSFIAKNGGVAAVHRLTGVSRVTLTLLKKEGRCAPEVMEVIFNTINENTI